ncbi:hypothetical protein [Halobellus rufus]|uniref:hypothetical protein n=1 Tax=Halobellus rufus TaxID=1448860 RepID=UPI0018CCC4F2|nr:hypothetical protein [Halobellus rufus]
MYRIIFSGGDRLDRIARLVEYFADYADYHVVALLPEDAQALDDDFTHVTHI